MPELPEVETIMRGLKPHLENAIIQDVVVRQPQLRWPIPSSLSACLIQQKILTLTRRGKYLLIHLAHGTLIIHLGMSGRLLLLHKPTPAARHDHVDVLLSGVGLLRYNDPRRFGAVLWTDEDPFLHPLIKTIGLEPFDERFTGEYLKEKAANRRVSIKTFIMNSKIVSGVGNIYAAESLFLARIHPALEANQLTLDQCHALVKSIKHILMEAIAQGGTTLKDFVDSEGRPGYFSQTLYVYGRASLPCRMCLQPLRFIKLGQRSTVYCQHCQQGVT